MQRFLILLPFLLLAGCAMNIDTTRIGVTGLHQVYTLDTSYAIEKVQYSSIKDTYYVWEKNTYNIHLYRSGKEINLIGGLGYAKENFQKLTDIGVGADGSLYCLDQMPKKLKKFDADGRWLLDYDVAWSQEPVKFALDQSNQIIFFDDIQREFTFSSDLRPEEVFQFGKFQVISVDQITINNNLLIVNEPEPKQTSFFSLLGEYMVTRQGRIVADRFGNLFRMDANNITMIPSNETAASSIVPYTGIVVFDPFLLTTTEHQIQKWQIDYAPKP